MRRKDREIESRVLIDNVVINAKVCRVAMCNNKLPYIVPLCFGYDGDHIYFHTATEGMKIHYMIANEQVCFEFENDVKIIKSDDLACDWSFSYYSVIGFGSVKEITEIKRKIFALNQIMKHYSEKEWEFERQMIEKTRLWFITIEQITGKHR